MSEPAQGHRTETEGTRAPRDHRTRVLKGASIIINMAKSEIPCTLRNQHANGAELKIAGEIALPARFTLYVAADGVAYESEIRWRRGDRVGVRFLGRGPKPRLHYG